VRVELAPQAAKQVGAISAWWTANRPAAPLLFAEELGRAVRVLERSPRTGTTYEAVPAYRRVILPRTRYVVYYREVGGDVVKIFAVWHGARGMGPPLP
jgi:plasmid stabilization system protein ParE